MEASDVVTRDDCQDPRFFSTLFKDRFKPLVNFVRRFPFSSEEAEDVVADAFACFYLKLDGIYDDIASTEGVPVPMGRLNASLAVMVKNYARNAFHKKQRRGELIDHEVNESDRMPQGSASESGRDGGSARSLELEAAIAKLNDRERNVLELRYWDDLTYAEISGILDVDTSTVCRILHRALRHLRALLEDDES